MRFKYPRTFHLPWSEGVQSDDKVISSLSAFEGKQIVVTEKMDGENTTMYNDHIHARSLDSRHHPSRDWVKKFWGDISQLIPDGWRVCGENLYARHSVHYTDLPTYFMGFSVWNEENVCLCWSETLEWFELLGITPVPVLYDGVYDESVIRSLWNAKLATGHEGYVVRLEGEVPYNSFGSSFAKFVRKGHVQTDQHWMQSEVQPNGLSLKENHGN